MSSWSPGGAAPAMGEGKGSSDPEPKKPGKGKGGKKGPPKGPPKSAFSAEELAKLKVQAEATKKAMEAEKAAGGLSAREAMLAELENRQKKGVTAGFKHIDKAKKKSGGYKDDRQKIVVDRSAAKQKAAADRAAASKVQRAEVNERTGFDQLKLAYCKGSRQQKERRVITVENPKKDAVTIQDCSDVIIDIQGIPKAVMITGCTKYHVTIPGCLTAVNVDNSNSGYMTLTGLVRTCQVDKCKDLDVTLSPEAYDCHFVSSKVSNLNVAIEQEGLEGTDLISMAVAAQFSTKLKFDNEGKAYLETGPTESAGE